MCVSLSITFMAFKFLALFVALVGTIDAGVTSGGLKGSEPLPHWNRTIIRKTSNT